MDIAFQVVLGWEIRKKMSGARAQREFDFRTRNNDQPLGGISSPLQRLEYPFVKQGAEILPHTLRLGIDDPDHGKAFDITGNLDDSGQIHGLGRSNLDRFAI